MATNTAVVSLPWYRSLSREQWGVLLASNLGWLFDGFEPVVEVGSSPNSAR